MSSQTGTDDRSHSAPFEAIQKRTAPVLPLLLVLLLVSGCDFIGDVLEFGFWTGVILVGIVVLIIWGVVKAFRR